MIYRRLGQTGLQVSLLSLGSWVTYDWQIDTDGARDIIEAAYCSGINFFDNAEAYAYGKSEEIMGKALEDLKLPREEIVISTKIYHGNKKDPAPTARGLSRKHVIEGLRSSLKRLRLDYVDIVYAHRPDPNVTIEEVVRAFNWVIEKGWAFYWGTSEWPASLVEEACEVADLLGLIAPAVEQPQYSLLHRKRVEVELTSVINSRGIGLTTFSPLACGLLTGKYSKGDNGNSGDILPAGSRFTVPRYSFLADRWLTPEKIQAAKSIAPIAESLGTTPACLAIAFCAANPAVSSVITGVTSVDQLNTNVNALDIVDKITPDVIKQIEEAVGGTKNMDMGAL